MFTFWKRAVRSIRLHPTVDRLIRYTYLVILAQAAAITMSSCESANSLTTPVSEPTFSKISPVSHGESRLLWVVGLISATDTGGGSFITNFTVDFVDHPGGRPKDDPRISANASRGPGSSSQASLLGPAGDIPLTRDPGNSQSYSATNNNYVPGTYTLSVVGADGELVTVNITVPDAHTITSPSPGKVVKANKRLKVKWTRDAAATIVLVETLDYVTKLKHRDNGNFTIPKSGNPPREDQVVRVKRINRQAVATGKTKLDIVAEFTTSVDDITVE